MFVFSEVGLSRMKVVRVILWYYIYNSKSATASKAVTPV